MRQLHLSDTPEPRICDSFTFLTPQSPEHYDSFTFLFPRSPDVCPKRQDSGPTGQGAADPGLRLSVAAPSPGVRDSEAFSKGFQRVSKGLRRVSQAFPTGIQRCFQRITQGLPKVFAKLFPRVTQGSQRVFEGFPWAFPRASKGCQGFPNIFQEFCHLIK